MMKEPVDHVARPPLPWRVDAHLTECGKLLTDLDDDRVIGVDDLVRRVRQQGQKRAAFSTCMTCWENAARWRSDQQDPISVVVRELQAVEHEQHVPTHGLAAAHQQRYKRYRARRQQVISELRAMVALVAAHRDEFDGYLAGLDETVSLQDRRRRRG